jgi:hypothetical protein
MTVLFATLLCAASPGSRGGTVGGGGMVAGMSHTSLAGDGAPSRLDGRIRYAVGAFLRVPMKPKLTFMPHLLYSQRGAEGPIPNSDGTSDTYAVLSYSYLDLDLLFQGSFEATPLIDLQLVGGPSVSYNMSAESRSRSTDLEPWDFDAERTTDLGEVTADFEAALVAGGGLSIRLRSGWSLRAELRYRHGLSTIDASSGNPSSLLHRSLTLFVGTGN